MVVSKARVGKLSSKRHPQKMKVWCQWISIWRRLMMIKVHQPLTHLNTWRKNPIPSWDGPKTKLPTIKDIYCRWWLQPRSVSWDDTRLTRLDTSPPTMVNMKSIWMKPPPKSQHLSNNAQKTWNTFLHLLSEFWFCGSTALILKKKQLHRQTTPHRSMHLFANLPPFQGGKELILIEPPLWKQDMAILSVPWI